MKSQPNEVMNDQKLLKKHLLKHYEFMKVESGKSKVGTARVTVETLQWQLEKDLFKPYANELVKVVFLSTGISRTKHTFADGSTDLVWYVKRKTLNSKL